jgi:phosphatidate cytidylyltransferase
MLRAPTTSILHEPLPHAAGARLPLGSRVMSPAAALHDPIFHAYLWVLLAVLVTPGVVLVTLQFGLHRAQGSVWSTYRSWIVMATLATAAIVAGRVPFIVAVAIVALLALREFARVSRLLDDPWMTGAVAVGIVAVAATSIAWPRGESAVTPVVMIGLILLVPILRDRPQQAVQRMSLGLIGFLYLGWMFGQLGFLANSPNAYGYICYVLIATEVSDVAAFTFGKAFGRHPLRREISPRKTWEGALGALAVSLALAWLLRFSFPFFGPRQVLLSGLVVGVGGQLGDLSISLIKRDLGTKDMGSAIPGHGGVLDRIDSLIFTAPLFLLLASYYYPGR